MFKPYFLIIILFLLLLMLSSCSGFIVRKFKMYEGAERNEDEIALVYIKSPYTFIAYNGKEASGKGNTKLKFLPGNYTITVGEKGVRNSDVKVGWTYTPKKGIIETHTYSATYATNVFDVNFWVLAGGKYEMGPNGVTKIGFERDDRFIAYDNGTVLDLSTSLVWGGKDNGENIQWQDAKEYCKNYTGGGYTNWRVPTQDELMGLYGTSRKGYKQDCNPESLEIRIVDLIHISCASQWVSEIRDSKAGNFDFRDGSSHWDNQFDSNGYRVLPVRNAN